MPVSKTEHGGGIIEPAPKDPRWHKGSTCIIFPELLCQEGYCSNCQVALRAYTAWASFNEKPGVN